eukprot:COSAG02_NODE_5032_length_4710_cov_1.603512_7_plen_139_part_00
MCAKPRPAARPRDPGTDCMHWAPAPVRGGAQDSGAAVGAAPPRSVSNQVPAAIDTLCVVHAGDGYGADDGGAGGRTSRMEEGLLRGRAGGGSINAPNPLATHTTDADATSWKRSRDLYASPVLHADGLEEVRTIVGIA